MLEKRAKSDIITPKQSYEVPGVNKICDLDIEKYKCITPNITTSEVIITDERIAHIKERHPNDYEKFFSYIPKSLLSPIIS